MDRKRPDIRPLNPTEIRNLEQALGAPVDREYLVHWVSQAIADVVALAGQPSPRRIRDRLLKIERDGRAWLRDVEESEAASFLAARVHLAQIRASTTSFCDRVASLVQEIDAVVRGRPRTSLALEVFVDRMIGIAKRAGVLPSTPSRRRSTSGTPNPAFFEFASTALRIARAVIKTSSLSDDQKAAALSKVRIQGPDALNKLVVHSRGRIGNYRSMTHGLVEWNSN
jgi:hypothetical protein